MTIHVTDILSKAVAEKGRVTPVDIVMGDHWAEIKLGNPLRLSLLGLMLRKQKQFGNHQASGGSVAHRRVSFEVARRSPQAMVKVIRKGGTTDARGMRDQMSYLEKDGDASLERSERYFGTELDTDAQEEMIEAWDLAGKSNTKSDKTTHFVVSFPRDTDHGSAYRAGRAWADEMFASGRYGDVFDYYTAFHIDRAHPHIHVIVNRRGLENGDWLKVSRRSQLNYEEFRAVQVEVAAREGIYLEATPRMARGLTDRPIPDAEIRGAEKENREARPPAHTPVSAIRAAASIALFSEQFTADAGLLAERHPELAKTMKAVATAILEGQQIIADPAKPKPSLTLEEAKKQSEYIMSRRSEIMDGIKEIDAEIGTIPRGADRASLERDASRIKADAAGLMPDVVELQGYLDDNRQGYYRGIHAEDGHEQDVKARADEEVGELADSIGIDPATLVSRYEGAEPVSEALGNQWRKDELEDILQNLTYQEPIPADQYEQLAKAAYDDLHRNALQTYREAERQLEAHAARKRELHRIARLIRQGRLLDDDTADMFKKGVKDTLHTNELRQLEAGEPEAFRYVTSNMDEQRALSRHYLKAEYEEANGVRKLQLATALAKIGNEPREDMDLATRETVRSSRRDRDLDR